MELNSETQHDLSNSEARTQKEKKRSRRGLKIWVPKFLDSDHNEKQSIRSCCAREGLVTLSLACVTQEIVAFDSFHCEHLNCT